MSSEKIQPYVDQAIAMLRRPGCLGDEEKWFLLAVLEGRVDDIVRRADKQARAEELKTQYRALERALYQELEEQTVGYIKAG